MMKHPFDWLAMLLLVLALAACSHDDAADTDKGIASVATVPVQRGSLPNILSAYGTAGAAADATITLSVQAPGRVTRWYVAPGALVKRGQKLLTFTPAPAAASAYQQAQHAVTAATADRAHVAALLAHQLATRDQLAQADKTLADAQSDLAALREDQGNGGTRDFIAPFDGTVVSLDATHGDALTAGAALMSLVRKDGLVGAVGVERAALGRVKPGDAVTLHAIEGGDTMQGVVRDVSHALDPHTHQLAVVITTDGPLVAGEGVRADITVGQWQGWLLPRDAVLGDDGDRHVFQIDGDKAVQVPVTVLGESDTTSVVNGKLDAKRALVTVGASQLDDGTAVHVAGDTSSADADK